MTIYGNANTVAEARSNAVRYPHNSYPIVSEYLGISYAGPTGDAVWADYNATLSNGDTWHAVLTGKTMPRRVADEIRLQLEGEPAEV